MFAKEVGNATERVNNLENETNKAGIAIGKFMKAGLSVLKKGFDMVTGSIDGAISRYDTLNTFPKVLEQIGFSADASEKAITKLSDGTKGLPTELDEVAKTTQRIAALTGDLENATDTTLALNNAFIASGSSGADASKGLEQYVQMLSKGKVDLKTWQSLQGTMGVALNDIAKAFGFAGASAQNDLYEALESGDITFDEFNSKLIEMSEGTNGFAERARTASGGIAASISNMRAAVTSGVANIIASIDEMLTSNGLPSIETMISNVGSIFEGVLNKVAGMISNLNGKFKDFSSIGDLLSVALTIAVQGLSTLMNKIVETIVANLPIIMASGANIIMAIVLAIVENIAIIIQSGAQIIQSIIEGMNLILPQFVLAILGLLQAFLETIAANIDVILNAGVMLLTTLITGLIGSINLIMSSMLTILTTLVQVITDNLPIIIQAGLTILLSLIDGVIAQLPLLIDMAINLILILVDSLVDNLPMIIDAGIKIIIAVVNGLIQAIPRIIAAVYIVFASLVGAIIKALPQVLAGGAKIVWELIKGIDSILGNILIAGGQLVMNIITGITGFFSNVFNAGKELGSKALEGISNISEKFLEAGKNIVTSIAEGISGAIGKVKDAIGNVTQKIRDFLPFSPAKEGALRDIMDIQLGQSIAQAIDKGRNVAVKSMANLTSAINSEMPTVDIAGRVNGIRVNGTHTRTNALADSTSGGIVQNITINSPQPLSPSEIVRKQKQASRQLALEWGV